MKGKSELKTIVAAISVSVPGHNATALKGDVQRDEVFFALHILGAFAVSREKHLLSSSCWSVCLPECNSAAHTGRIFVKFDIGDS
jgi:hypothetical protein